MQVETKWTLGNIVSATTLVGLIISLGFTYGQVSSRIDRLEEVSRQSSLDSRTLIEVSKDVAYIKDSIQAMQRMTAAIWSTQPPLSCPTEQPVLVASHCRSYPSPD